MREIMDGIQYVRKRVTPQFLIILIMTITACSHPAPAPVEPILKDETLTHNTYLQQIHKLLHDPNSPHHDFATERQLPETSNHKQNAEQIRAMLGESRKLIHNGTVVDYITYRVPNYNPPPERFITNFLTESQFICKQTGTTYSTPYDVHSFFLYVKGDTVIDILEVEVPEYPSDYPAATHVSVSRLMAVEYHNVTQLFEDCSPALEREDFQRPAPDNEHSEYPHLIVC